MTFQPEQSIASGVQKFCKHCDQPFAPKVKWQEFCCSDCQQTWHKSGKKVAGSFVIYQRVTCGYCAREWINTEALTESLCPHCGTLNTLEAI